MAKTARQRMVSGAAKMISTRGVGPASVRDLAKQSGAPLGSTYHYFPGGKDQLIDEAVQLVGDRVERIIREALTDDPLSVVDAVCAEWRRILIDSDFHSGCAVLAVATADTGQETPASRTASVVFERWKDALTDALAAQGVEPDRARRLAWLVITGLEGAVAVARSRRSTQPLDDVALELRQLLAGAID